MLLEELNKGCVLMLADFLLIHNWINHTKCTKCVPSVTLTHLRNYHLDV